MREEVRYFTFPIELLRDAFFNIGDVCFGAIAYAVYARSQQYQEGSPEEAFKFFGISGDVGVIFKRGQELYGGFTKPVLVSVRKDIVFDFCLNRKTDFEIAVFCAYCGIRSVIGVKAYVKTNNGLLIARMFGYATAKEFEALNPKPRYYQDFFRNKRTIAYQLNKKIIQNELEFGWGLKYYSNHLRGFYVSFALEFEELVLHAEKERKSTLLEQQQQAKRQVVVRVRRQLRG